MSMERISIEQAKKMAKIFGVRPCRIKGTEIVQIRKNPSDKYDDISWDEFEETLKKRGLALFKSEKGNFLKIMKG